MWDLIFNPTVIAAFAAVAAIIMAYLKGDRDRKTKEENKQMKRDVEVRETNDEIIDDADRARRDVDNIELHEDDGFRRKD